MSRDLSVPGEVVEFLRDLAADTAMSATVRGIAERLVTRYAGPRYRIGTPVVVDARISGPWGVVYRLRRAGFGFEYDIRTSVTSDDNGTRVARVIEDVDERRLTLQADVVDKIAPRPGPHLTAVTR